MKLKSLFIKTIAMGAVASLAVNCHAKKVDENPLLFYALSNTITSLAQGNCAISVNITALSYQNAIKTAVDNTIVAGGPIYASDAAASTAFITHYNAVNGTNVDKAGLLAAQYNKKFDTFFTDLGTWNGTTRAAYLKAVYNAIVAGLPTGAIGTGLLACARIPKANCSFAGATTANQESDLASARKTYDAIYNNSDCRKDLTILQTLKDNIFKGAPATVQSLQDGAYTNPATNGNTASFATTQSILAEKGYPKFGSFVSLGFGALMPVKDGNTAFSLTTTEYVAGSNIAFTNVSTCESIGMGDKGISVATGTTLLTPVTEVAYALSTNGTAASAYNTARGLANGLYSATAAGEDAKNCNNSFRAKSPISLLLGGGKLPPSNGGKGDGDTTVLLTTCVYGKDTTARTAAKGALNASLAGISDCPAAAAAGAAKFGDAGLTNLANFPND